MTIFEVAFALCLVLPWLALFTILALGWPDDCWEKPR